MKLNQFISELQKIQKEHHGDLHVNILSICTHKGFPLTKWQGDVTQIQIDQQYPDQLKIFFSKKEK